MIKAGDLRNYVTIQAGTRTSDGQGGWTVAWVDTYYEWMKATPQSMSRSLEQGGVKYHKAVEFRCRYRDDLPTDLYNLTGDYRLTWNSENYTIHSVVPDEKLSELTIIAYV
jgi:head-tail adaptor